MNLKPLDVILLEGDRSNIFEATIILWSRSIFTHVVVAKDTEGNIWDATLGGILNHHIDYYKDRYKIIERYKHELTDNQIRLITAWINEKQATCKGYDWPAWFGFATGVEAFEDEDRWYCSELPYWMFQDNGIKLTWRDKRLVYPSFFLKSGKFQNMLQG